jgi:hypothetical protein
LIQITIDRKITQEELKFAVRDKQLAADKLGMSKVESERLQDHISELANSLLMKYPELKKMVETQRDEQCGDCQIDQFINNWNKIRAQHDQDNGRELLRMSYVTYIVALVACAVGSAGNVLFYAICSYVVYCSYTGKC